MNPFTKVALFAFIAAIAIGLLWVGGHYADYRIEQQANQAPVDWTSDGGGISHIDVAGARCFANNTHNFTMQCIPLKDL